MNRHSENRRNMRYTRAEFADRLILFLVLAGIALFILYPIASVVATSFFKNGRFTLEYYLELATPKSLKLIKNSLWVSTLSSVCTTAAAFFIALAVYAESGKRRNFIRNGLLLTMISPPFVSALAYILLFGRRGIIIDLLLFNRSWSWSCFLYFIINNLACFWIKVTLSLLFRRSSWLSRF